MIFLLLTCLCVIPLLGFTLAHNGYYRISTDTLVHEKDFIGQELKVRDPETLLCIHNVPFISFRVSFVNHGSTIISTDENAEVSDRNDIQYVFSQHIVNRGLFVVQHNNTELPLHVLLPGGARYFFLSGLLHGSVNQGHIVLLSHGPPGPKKNGEFHIRLLETFLNSGVLSVVGTQAHQAQLDISLCVKKVGDQAFQNSGLIYLKEAILYQRAHFDRQGCIVLGENSVFFTDPAWNLDHQRFHFLHDSARLVISGITLVRTPEYIVSSFPKGSTISVPYPMTQLDVQDSTVTVSSGNGRLRMQFIFEGFKELQKEKFLLLLGTLTYEDDLVREAPHFSCKALPRAMEFVGEYEIRPE